MESNKLEWKQISHNRICLIDNSTDEIIQEIQMYPGPTLDSATYSTNGKEYVSLEGAKKYLESLGYKGN